MFTPIHAFVAIIASVAIGIGIGRIKNAAKLAAIKAEISNAEAYVTTEAKALAAAIKKHL